MPESKRSPVLAAVDAIHAALKGLAPADRAKVLAAVAALLDIPAGEGTLPGGALIGSRKLRLLLTPLRNCGPSQNHMVSTR